MPETPKAYLAFDLGAESGRAGVLLTLALLLLVGATVIVGYGNSLALPPPYINL